MGDEMALQLDEFNLEIIQLFGVLFMRHLLCISSTALCRLSDHFASFRQRGCGTSRFILFPFFI